MTLHCSVVCLFVLTMPRLSGMVLSCLSCRYLDMKIHAYSLSYETHLSSDSYYTIHKGWTKESRKQIGVYMIQIEQPNVFSSYLIHPSGTLEARVFFSKINTCKMFLYTITLLCSSTHMHSWCLDSIEFLAHTRQTELSTFSDCARRLQHTPPHCKTAQCHWPPGGVMLICPEPWSRALGPKLPAGCAYMCIYMSMVWSAWLIPFRLQWVQCWTSKMSVKMFIHPI